MSQGAGQTQLTQHSIKNDRRKEMFAAQSSCSGVCGENDFRITDGRFLPRTPLGIAHFVFSEVESWLEGEELTVLDKG